MINIALFTTSSRTIETARVLNKNFNLKLIVTKNDKIVGRSKVAEPNEVKLFAIENKINLIEIEKFDLEKKEQVIQLMIQNNIDLGISFDFGFIIPEKLFNLPPLKFINIHFSLLPKHRGASAVQFAILADEKEFGITYHYVSAKLDCGEILYQSIFNLDENLTAGDAYKFLFVKTSEEIVEVLNKIIKKEVLPQVQNEEFSTITFSKTNPKHTFIFKEDAYSDFSEHERTLFRKIKAYNPWPILYTEIKNLLKINQFKDYILKPEVDENLIVKVSDANFNNNHLQIVEITPTGKKKLNYKEFTNGYLIKNR